MVHRGTRAVTLLLGVFLSFAWVPGANARGSIETAGDVLQLVLPATAAGVAIGFKDGEGTLEFAESMALTLGVTYGLKYAVDERRPNGGSHSFPSGHTSISFSSAEFMRERYGWQYGLPAYAVAAFVAFSRVQAKQHYVHDVLAGAVIGAASSVLFTTPYRGWSIAAEADGAYFGARLSRVW